MRLECTKKLLDYLNLKPDKAADTVDSIFVWTANLINRRLRNTYRRSIPVSYE